MELNRELGVQKKWKLLKIRNDDPGNIFFNLFCNLEMLYNHAQVDMVPDILCVDRPHTERHCRPGFRISWSTC